MSYPCEIPGLDIQTSTLVPLDAYELFRGELELVIRQCMTEPVCATAEVVNEYSGEVVVTPFFADSIQEAQDQAIAKVMALYEDKKSNKREG